MFPTTPSRPTMTTGTARAVFEKRRISVRSRGVHPGYFRALGREDETKQAGNRDVNHLCSRHPFLGGFEKP